MIATFLRLLFSSYKYAIEKVFNSYKISNLVCSSSSVFIHPSCNLVSASVGMISIGSRTVIGRSNSFYVSSPRSEKRLSNLGIKIGVNCIINEMNHFRAGESYIDIGDRVIISQSVIIVSTNYKFPFVACESLTLDTACHGIVIGDDTFIGAGSIILPGTHIGARVVIGAGSVVTGGYVPPDSVFGGNPARFIKHNTKPSFYEN